MGNKTLYILEDMDCNRLIFRTKEAALRRALEWLERSYEDNKDLEYATDKQKAEDFRSLLKSYIDSTYDGFYIDEFCWCYGTDFIDE